MPKTTPFLSVSTVLAQIAETDPNLTADELMIVGVSPTGDMLFRVYDVQPWHVWVCADADGVDAAPELNREWLAALVPSDAILAADFTLDDGCDVRYFAGSDVPRFARV